MLDKSQKNPLKRQTEYCSSAISDYSFGGFSFLDVLSQRFRNTFSDSFEHGKKCKNKNCLENNNDLKVVSRNYKKKADSVAVTKSAKCNNDKTKTTKYKSLVWGEKR